jgi:phage-related tail protein
MVEKEKTRTMESDFIESVESQLSDWQDDFDRLEDMVGDAGENFQHKYDEQIANLERYLDDFKEQVDKLRSTESDQWEKQRLNVQKSARTYRQAYGQTIELMDKEKSRPAGWLEGFTNRPPAGSEGWLEGFDATPQGSEGWVEGVAERTPETKGWTEGYEEED